MVYVKKWTDFEIAVTDLYAKAPRKTRYCIKFKPSSGHLVLKVTDDTTCLKYKTFSSIILNRFESLNLRLLSQIANVKPKARLIPNLAAAGASIGRAGTPGMDEEGVTNSGLLVPGEGAGTPARQGTPIPEGAKAAGTPGGGKKKKKGKK